MKKNTNLYLILITILLILILSWIIMWKTKFENKETKDIDKNNDIAIKIENNNWEDLTEEHNTWSYIENEIKNINISDFYDEDYDIIKKLMKWEDSKKTEQYSSKWYNILNYLFNWVDYDKLSSDEKLLTNCIHDSYEWKEVNYEKYENEIKNSFNKSLCIWEDTDSNLLWWETYKIYKDTIINILKSNNKKEENTCKKILNNDIKNKDYFLCIWISYRDINKLEYIMKLYIYSDLAEKRCDILKDNDNYLYEKCLSTNKIWKEKWIIE